MVAEARGLVPIVVEQTTRAPRADASRYAETISSVFPE